MIGQCVANTTCLNGGVCSFDNLCLCPAGWINDYVGFVHQENCSLPDTFLFWFFVVYTVLTVASLLVTAVMARHAKKVLLLSRNFYILWLLADWLVVFTVYIEGGFFVATCIVNLLFIWFSTFGPAYFVFQIFSVSFRLAPDFKADVLERRFNMFVLFWNVALNTPLYITGAVFARNEDPTVYNAVFAAWLMQFGICLSIYFAAFVYFFKKFESVLRGVVKNHGDASLTADVKRAVSRVEGLVQASAMSLPFGLAYVIVGACLFSGLNVPYLWVFWLLIFTGPVQNLGNFMQTVRDARANPTSSKREELDSGAFSNKNAQVTAHVSEAEPSSTTQQ